MSGLALAAATLDEQSGEERDVTAPLAERWHLDGERRSDHANVHRTSGGTPYVIPEGGSNALGSWGYIRAARELVAELDGIATPDQPVTIVSGGATR